jgi:CheY-like chemotaxis protein
VQGIVRGHKGAIKVYSQPGKGSTFKVFLPVTEQPARLAPALPAAANGGGELVLVVDDEEIIRRTAKSMLERHGYTVVVAEDGQRGLEIFKIVHDKVAAVLLDMTMPVLSGEETFSRLKEICPDVKVLLSSGYNESEAIRRFTGKGLAGFIQKPYSSTTLIEKLDAIIKDVPA